MKGRICQWKKPCHLPKLCKSAWFCAIWNGSRSVRVWCRCSALRGRLIHLFESVPPCPRPQLCSVGAPPAPTHLPTTLQPRAKTKDSGCGGVRFTPFSPLHRDTGSHPPRPVRSRVHSSAVKLCLLVLFLFFILFFLTVDLSLDTGVVWLTANYFYLGFVFFVFFNLLSVYTCLFLQFLFLSRWCLIFLFSKKKLSILELFCQH